MKPLNTLLLYARILIFIFYLTTVMQRSIFVGRQWWYRVWNKKGTDLARCFGTTDVSQDEEKCRAVVNPVTKI